MNLSSRVKITKCADYTGAGTSDVEGTILDMSGYEGVLFIASFGTPAANNTLHAQQDTDVAGGAMADLLGTSVGVGASDEDVWLDVHKPRERYVRAVADRGTSTTLECLIAIQYGARNMPVDNAVAGTIHGEQHTSPIEGTA